MRTVVPLATLIVALTACGKAAAPEPRSYTLYFLGFASDPKEPAGGIAVTISVPSSWKEGVGPTRSPFFEPSGWSSFAPSVNLAAIPCPADATTADACVDGVLKQQGGDFATLTTERGAAGSRWITSARDVKGHHQVHAQRLLPASSAHGVVVCDALLIDDDRKRVDEVRRACDTLALR